ncbi:hypothetical protein AXK61_23805 [Tsukamurella pseudospumae]|uniref:Uncharacterized protein n=2 Tax=Tsukamurella pseudospumae TaxID=239498 RepID=A0A137Z7Z9_9ACTN|nr:hypothetical protein AXK61_23805 [Tsukamurella pseudospumae]
MPPGTKQVAGTPWPDTGLNRSRAVLLGVFSAVIIAFFGLAVAAFAGWARVAAAFMCVAFVCLAAGAAAVAGRKYRAPGPRQEWGVNDEIVFLCWPGAAYMTRVVVPFALGLSSVGVALIGNDAASSPSGYSEARGGPIFFYVVGAVGVAIALVLMLKPRGPSQWTEIRIGSQGVCIVSGSRRTAIDWNDTASLEALPTNPNELRPYAQVVLARTCAKQVKLPLGRAQIDPNVLWKSLVASRNRVVALPSPGEPAPSREV